MSDKNNLQMVSEMYDALLEEIQFLTDSYKLEKTNLPENEQIKLNETIKEKKRELKTCKDILDIQNEAKLSTEMLHSTKSFLTQTELNDLESELNIEKLANKLNDKIEFIQNIPELTIIKRTLPKKMWNVTEFQIEELMGYARNNKSWCKNRIIAMPYFDEQELLKNTKDIPWWGLKFCTYKIIVRAFGTFELLLWTGHKQKKGTEWRYPTPLKKDSNSFHFLYDDEDNTWKFVNLLRKKKDRTPEDEELEDKWNKRKKDHIETEQEMIKYGRYFRYLLKTYEKYGDIDKAPFGKTVGALKQDYKNVLKFFEKAKLHLDILEFKGEITEEEKNVILNTFEKTNEYITIASNFLNEFNDDSDLTKNSSYADNGILEDIKAFQFDNKELKKHHLIQDSATFLQVINERIRNNIFAKRKDIKFEDLKEEDKIVGTLGINPKTNLIYRNIPSIEQLRGMTVERWGDSEQDQLDKTIIEFWKKEHKKDQ